MRNYNTADVMNAMNDEYAISPITSEAELSEKMEEYEKSDEIKRAMMFGVQLKTTHQVSVAYTRAAEELKKALQKVDTAVSAPEETNILIKKFFQSKFPNFTTGAASAIGTHYKKAIDKLRKDHGILDRGKIVHLKRSMHLRLGKSGSGFIKEINKSESSAKKRVFYDLLDEYLEIRWEFEVSKDNQTHSDSVIYEKMQRMKTEEVRVSEKFIEDNITIFRGNTVDDYVIYDKYAKFAEENEYPMMGKSKFYELVERMTGAHYTKARNGEGFFTGIRLAGHGKTPSLVTRREYSNTKMPVSKKRFFA